MVDHRYNKGDREISNWTMTRHPRWRSYIHIYIHWAKEYAYAARDYNAGVLGINSRTNKQHSGINYFQKIPSLVQELMTLLPEETK
jgi:hypothetical protein